MKQIKHLVLGMLIIAGSVLSFGNFQTVSAEAYIWKFNVPVQVKNIGDPYNKVGVYIKILTKDKKEIGYGSGQAGLNSNGDFSGTITVYIYPKDINGPISQVSSYKGGLLLHGPTMTTDCTPGWAQEHAQKGTLSVTALEGPLEAPPPGIALDGLTEKMYTQGS